MKLNKIALLFSLFFALGSTHLQGYTPQPAIPDSVDVFEKLLMERITVVSSPVWVSQIPGAASYIDTEQLSQQGYTDIHRILRTVSGVNLQEEDGFGLRPNIGLRGTGSERSSKINIMEDGVLMAPAPYSAPAAYYFPTVARMNAVEVRKGSSQIKYGPNTTGGAINFISTRIPYRLSGEAEASIGEFNSNKFYGKVGNSGQNFGFILEGLQLRNDGFKKLDGDGNTGFRTYDFMGKVMARTNPDAAVYQRFEFKLGYYDENSNETYLGITRDDFAVNPFRRYAGSQRDRMKADHLHLMGRHFAQFSEKLDLTTTIYRNNFKRNWYKLQTVGGSNLMGVLADPENNTQQMTYLIGGDSPDDALLVRANNREYFSQGVESILVLDVPIGDMNNQFEFGVRLHQDEEDRFQYEDRYRMESGQMLLTTAGIPGTQANRIGSATALSVYLQDRIRIENFTITPGVRFESIWFENRNFGGQDIERSGSSLQQQDNHVSVLVPGIGITYALSSELTWIGGVHKGFSPPSPGSSSDTRSEQSVNFETGFRYSDGSFHTELIGYYNNYQNLLGSDLQAGGGGGTTAQFNAGEVRVYGIELSSQFELTDLNLLASLPFTLPVHLTYTLTDATFQSSFSSNFGPWGDVESGDEIPFIPRHQFNAGAGIHYQKISLHLNANSTSRMRTRAGSGDIPADASTDNYFILDASGSYQLLPAVNLFASVRNLLNEHYIVSDRPAGVRPGLPRMVTGGLRISF